MEPICIKFNITNLETLKDINEAINSYINELNCRILEIHPDLFQCENIKENITDPEAVNIFKRINILSKLEKHFSEIYCNELKD